MSLSRDSADERIWKLIRRTQFRVQQGIERIRWEESVLFPEIEAMKAGLSKPTLPKGVFEVEIIHEDTDSLPASDASQSDGAAAPTDSDPDAGTKSP
jgi:hypothetical protein